MERRISVVITMQRALGLSVTSPVLGGEGEDGERMEGRGRREGEDEDGGEEDGVAPCCETQALQVAPRGIVFRAARHHLMS